MRLVCSWLAAVTEKRKTDYSLFYLLPGILPEIRPMSGDITYSNAGYNFPANP